MPNLLAHFGVQGLAMQPLVRRADALWVLTGCLIPDVSWILHRFLRLAGPGLNPYDLRLYAIAQSSLLVSLILAAATAFLSIRIRRTFAILSAGCVLHLLLDAVETKWANGVHLFAPFSWELLNFGLFWPESPLIQVITVLGLGYLGWLVWIWRRSGFETSAASIRVSASRVGGAGAALSLYLFLPLGILGGPQAADNHYVATLRDREARPGRHVEFDRNRFVMDEGGGFLRTFAGEELVLVGDRPDRSGPVSVRGTFVDEGTVAVIEVHRHWQWGRDAASYLALLTLAGVWIIAVRRARTRGGMGYAACADGRLSTAPSNSQPNLPRERSMQPISAPVDPRLDSQPANEGLDVGRRP